MAAGTEVDVDRYSMSETTPGDRLMFAESCLIPGGNRDLIPDRSLGSITSGRLRQRSRLIPYSTWTSRFKNSLGRSP